MKNKNTPIVASKRGRPIVNRDTEIPLGYKVKVGGTYVHSKKVGRGHSTKIVEQMREATLFESEAEAQTVINKMVDKGQIRIWGGKPRAKILARYNQSHD